MPPATWDYVISGLRVRSEMEFPSAVPTETAGAPDVEIVFGDVPLALPNAEREGPDWALAGNTFLLRLQGVLRAEITSGSRMVVQAEGETDRDAMTLYVLGTCFAVILHQRGRVVLHASAVAVDGVAMLFCGQSGAGKSTMAAMLSKRGYPLLNDDVCNLQPGPDGSYVVYPDGRMLKLWSESMEHLRVEERLEARVRRDVTKYYAAPENVDLTPRPVGGVFLLEAIDDDGTPASLQPISSAQAMAELSRNAYRPTMVRSMNMTEEYFAASIAIQRHAGVYQLRRPIAFARAEETMELLEAHWASRRAQQPKERG